MVQGCLAGTFLPHTKVSWPHSSWSHSGWWRFETEHGLRTAERTLRLNHLEIGGPMFSPFTREVSGWAIPAWLGAVLVVADENMMAYLWRLLARLSMGKIERRFEVAGGRLGDGIERAADAERFARWFPA